MITTQELIAHVLGVRREGVTEAAGRLQKLGVIVYRRGTSMSYTTRGSSNSVANAMLWTKESRTGC